MKRIVGLVIVFYLFIGYINCALGMEFDISVFEKNPDLYSIYRENGNIYIEPNVSAEEQDFYHKNSSEFYYNAIFPDIIVLNAESSNKTVVPRIWICYRTDTSALNIKYVEFTIYNTKYNFTIENQSVLSLDNGAISEDVVIILGEQSADFLRDWSYIASVDREIKVTLIGDVESVEFSVPPKVAKAGTELFLTYSINGGIASMSDYHATPVVLSAINEPLPEGTSQTYHDVTNGTSFTIPGGWSIVRNESDETSTSVKIRWESKDKTSYASIQYKAVDVYQQMLQSTPANQVFAKMLGRTAMDNTMMTKTDYADIWAVPVSEIIYEKLGSYEYYSGNITKTDSTTVPGHEYSTTVTIYGNIDNGYMYNFTFTGDQSKINDFKELLKSVRHNTQE